jgi:hypothetical protein
MGTTTPAWFAVDSDYLVSMRHLLKECVLESIEATPSQPERKYPE